MSQMGDDTGDGSGGHEEDSAAAAAGNSHTDANIDATISAKGC